MFEVVHQQFLVGNKEVTFTKVRRAPGTRLIIVTPMTTPFFMPALQQAAAVVTDEGGTLSHAAIIAREMRKPCVIGTKIATKVFKDGDLVEVDAEKGTMKKVL